VSTDIGLREAYLAGAATVPPLLRDPAVAAGWNGPSALPEFAVRGLAGHLASQIFMVSQSIDGEASDLDAIALSDHYARVTWIDAPLDSVVNTFIRDNGEAAAEGGAEVLADAVNAAVASQTASLAAMSSEHRVTAPSGQWALTLDDFVLTRLMEIAVHSDDLAVSVGIETPPLADDVVAPVLGLLAGISLRRHGQVAMLRALSRSERAPETISAF
jgi:Mycothiol maleylpyruvate isomerase N-terminal domain